MGIQLLLYHALYLPIYRWLSPVVVVSILKQRQQLCDNYKMAIAVCSCIFTYQIGTHRPITREYTINLYTRMVQVITSHHKYIQLSGSNLAIPIFSTMAMVMMLGLWPSIMVARYIHVSF